MGGWWTESRAATTYIQNIELGKETGSEAILREGKAVNRDSLLVGIDLELIRKRLQSSSYKN